MGIFIWKEHHKKSPKRKDRRGENSATCGEHGVHIPEFSTTQGEKWVCPSLKFTEEKNANAQPVCAEMSQTCRSERQWGILAGLDNSRHSSDWQDFKVEDPRERQYLARTRGGCHSEIHTGMSYENALELPQHRWRREALCKMLTGAVCHGKRKPKSPKHPQIR